VITSDIKKQINVGIIGLGIMGSSFASNLLSRGYNIHVYNRTKEKAQPFVEKGAIFHPTPKALASKSDIIMTSLTDEAAVDAVAYGKEGLLNGAKKGALWIDLSTIDPSASIKHSKAAKQAGLERLDTPVVGSKDLALKGELIILVGGNLEIFKKYEKFLSEIGKTVIYLGEDGNGHKMKLVINLHLGLLAEAFSEALVFSQKLGFEPKTFVETINNTPHKNYFSLNKGSKIVEGNFEPAFSLNNLFKDLKLVEKEMIQTRAILPMTSIVIEEYSKVIQKGEGQKDISFIVREIQKKNGLEN
jgi:3-hydroxyisobutyrate dehydrogenase-like beta-hydroxyacid dehydrogenase